MKAFALSYCILLFHVWLLSLEGLLCSEGKRKGNESWEEGRLGGARGSGERGKCGWNVLYEGRIYFQLKNAELLESRIFPKENKPCFNLISTSNHFMLETLRH